MSSFEQTLDRASALAFGSKAQRLMVWRTTLTTSSCSPEFLSSQGPRLCELVLSTVPEYSDKACRLAVLKCLETAFQTVDFLKVFASAFCKALSNDKGQPTPLAVLNATSCACALLSALATHSELSKAITKVLQVVDASLSQLGRQHTSTLHTHGVCLRRLSSTLYSHASIQAAAETAPSCPVVCAALLQRCKPPQSASDAAVKAYITAVVSSKEKLSDSAVQAWAPCTQRFTSTNVCSALESLAPMAKRSAETALSNAQTLFNTPTADMAGAAGAATDLLSPLLRHSKPTVVQLAISALSEFSTRVKGAAELADMALAATGVLSGAAGPKPKSAKERVALAEMVQGMCPAAWDRKALHGMHGDVRGASMRVAAALAKYVPDEPVAEAKVAVLCAVETWCALTGWYSLLYGPGKENTDVEGEQTTQCNAHSVVKCLVSQVEAKDDQEARKAACSALAALAADSVLVPSLKPAVKAAEMIAQGGASKASLRAAGCAGIAVVAAVATIDSGSEVPSSVEDAIESLLAPSALAAADRHAAYAALACFHMLSKAPSAARIDVTTKALAAMALQNAPLPRSTAGALLQRATKDSPRVVMAAMHALSEFLATFPNIPGTEGPAPAAGEAPVPPAAKVIGARVSAVITLMAGNVPKQDAQLYSAMMQLLHLPVVCHLHRHKPPPDVTRLTVELFKRFDLTDSDTLVAVAQSAGAQLQLKDGSDDDMQANGGTAPHGTPYGAHDTHVAAQRTMAAALALAPDAVWPACCDILQKLMDPTELHALHENDLRIFRTPRGKLMIEEFRSQLSPDELIAQRSAPVKVSKRKQAAAVADDASKKPASKKKPALSKEEQQRQEMLESEEDVRQYVEEVQQQLHVGCGTLMALTAVHPASIRADMKLCVSLLSPLLCSTFASEGAPSSRNPSTVGAFEAATAVASTLPMASPPSHISAALQVALRATKNPTAEGSERLAFHESVVTAVADVSQHVDKGEMLSASEYTLVFPILQAVLSLPNASPLHPDALAVLEAHVDAASDASTDLLTQHLKVLFHLTEVAPAFSRVTTQLLTQLLPHVDTAADVAVAVSGFVLPLEQGRSAALSAAQQSNLYSSPPSQRIQEYLLQPSALAPLWVAMHDTSKENVALAATLWDDCASGVDSQSTQFLDAVLEYAESESTDVRAAAARATSHTAASEDPLVTHVCMHAMGACGNVSVARRHGAAVVITEVAAALSGPEEIARVMQFILETGLIDRDDGVRGAYVDAGSAVVSAHGASQLQKLMPLIEEYLQNKNGLEEDLYDQVRTGAAVFLSGMAKHLPKEDPKIKEIVAVLKDILSTPSEVVQATVSDALSPLAPKLATDAEALSELVQYFLETLTKGASYGKRRGAAYGLAGLVKGTGISALKKQGIMDAIKAATDTKSDKPAKEGGLMAIECLCSKLGRMFEPYIITVLPMLLAAFSDGSQEVRAAASDASRVIMRNLTGPGVKLVLPTLLKGVNERAWRTKLASIELLGAMSNCAPSQLAASLPSIVPALAGVLNDAHPKVSAAASSSIDLVGAAIRNPEVAALTPKLIRAIADPVRATKGALEALRDMVFVHTIDVSSLALILPVIGRGLKERNGESKKAAARILGNLASLVGNPRDLSPYVPGLMPDLKSALIDALPDVRATAARSLGSLVRGLGQEHVEETLPWLLALLSSESSSVERSGAALGLAEVVAVLGEAHLLAIIPGIVAGCSSKSVSVRDGNLTLLVHLPTTCRRTFEPHLEKALPCVVQGLADEAEEVRGTAMAAAMKIVDLYATTSTPLLMPVLETSLLNDNWRIRDCATKLLGELLYKIAGTSGKVQLDGGSDDEGAATESYASALVDTLGVKTRNRVLARIYLVRNDTSPPVRHSAVHVWKSVVVNTPKTLRQILPCLMDISVAAIAGAGEDPRIAASRCLGELVRKMSSQVLGVVIPTLVSTMESEDPAIRAGVCLALKEVLDSLTRDELAQHLPALLPAVQAALCDDEDSVRAAAGESFAVLFRGGAGSTVEGMLPGLLEGLNAGGAKAEQSVQGLRVIVSVRPALLDRILPKLLALPLRVAGVQAAAPLLMESTTGTAASSHAAFALPRLLALPMPQRRDGALRAAARKAAASAILAAKDAASTAEVVRLVLRQLDAVQSRAAAANAITDWVAAGPAADLFEPHKPILITSTIELLGEKDKPPEAPPAESNDEEEPSALAQVWAAVKALLGTIPKTEMPSHVNTVHKALSSAADVARREAEPGDPVTLPGLALPKGLEPLVDIFLQGLLQGSPEVRESAADAIREAVALTPTDSLRPFVVKITGPLIRIVGDRFAPPVKAAILRALGAVIGKAGTGLKPFVPQLQTTFLKCLPDADSDIRMQAASNLGSLAAHMTARIDQLALDLASKSSDSDVGKAKAYLTALRGVLQNAGQRLTDVSLPSLCTTFDTLLRSSADNEDVHVPLASCMGEFCGISPPETAKQMLESTCLQDPLPPEAGHTIMSAIVLPVLTRHRTGWLAELGLLQDAVSAAVRCIRHKQYAVKVAAVRAFGRMMQWAVQAERVNDVLGLVEVAKTALAPDQDGNLHVEIVHNLREIAGVEHEGVPALLDKLAGELLPSLCAVVSSASGMFHSSVERCIARLLQVEHGITHAREIASSPGMGSAVKALLTEPYLRKIASMPQKSTFDMVIDEEY